ncbi:bifunctional diguanylate cyclase/phosphodiesterase [Arenimonas sp.]|uniref:bifunctional diguanylate cyclase/phosphodiesterase n=1 Tax=Arenimonas sp. TaxID=1872635 RepID=UPI002E2FFF46|nr:EAL domain-containing protein [Arenimonas sp.]HEX4855035.1 EAL domain-containing protein [Arenimonas sp.]
MENRRKDGGFLGQPAWLWSLGALLFGLALSLLAASLHRDALARSEQVRLERLAERSFDAVDSQLQTCGLLVRSVQALFLASDEVTIDEFEAMYSNLRPREQFPSLQAIAYARKADRSSPDAAPDGQVHYPTVLVAPMQGNRMLLGLDIATQPANLAAAQFSRDADQPVMSAAFRLIQRANMPGSDDGLTIRLPVFSPGPQPRDLAERRAREMGSLAASFRVNRLIEDALPREALDRFDLEVYDISDGEAAPRRLYTNPLELEPRDGVEMATFVRDLAYAGRTWRMVADAELLDDEAGWLPLLTFGIGCLASLLMATLAWSIAGTRARALALARDMSSQYRESEERFRALNELLPALVLLARVSDGQVVYANQACRDRFGISDEFLSPALAELVEDPAMREQLVAMGVDPGAIFNETVKLRVPGQEPFWATLSVSRIMLGEQPHLLAVANDITELRVLSEELSYQATHDSLTGLHNRREFERQLDAAIAALDAGAPPAALLYMDLDQFKLVNDTSGHYAGDQLLAQLAALFAGLLPRDAIVARLGGDEFAFLLVHTDEARAAALAEKIRLEIDGYVFGWEQRNYTISASIGVVMMRGPGLSQRTLLAHADTACYMAKERGRNRVHLFSEDDLETTQRRSEMEWAGRIRQALADGRFLLHFQELAPLWYGEQAEGVHVEMLVRLRDESGAMVPPGAFIPAAERFGLMPQLDRWVVDTTLANFHRIHPSGKPVKLCAINLSGPTFEDDSFADFVLQRLEDYGVPPQRICFEITETAAVSSMARAVEFMQKLRAAGCRFSLDDFGSGMASFGYLKNLPVDFIKIDGSFIRNIETDPVSYSIVRAVTDIGHQLGLQVVAEWVADDRARDLLRGLSVDYAQGFAIHKPEAALCFRE